ncbi:FtsW/RodA/SpoVE family cell cycle protein [Ornithinibacillus sp. 179-J 7C1 HS]|uniref:FtsW/RodA/SpoVE family cell cycle protein n=1 Tax=Ornithinibacillus sp. 179-J 7C1 HS TaxID=3142384 RepID=UPI0039A3953B
MESEKKRIPMDIILVIFFLMLISLLSLYNLQQTYPGSENFVLKQSVWFGIGILFMIGIRFLDLNQLFKLSLPAYIMGVLVLGVLLINPGGIAPEINGANSWFVFGGISMQPAEFAKFTTILCMSYVIVKHKNKYGTGLFKSDFILFSKLLVVTAIPVSLIMLQPDFGTSVVYLIILGVTVLLSGINWKLILLIAASFVIIIGSAFFIIITFPEESTELLPIAPYQVDRIMTWVQESEHQNDKNFQVTKSLLAIGSGQLFGKGFNNLEVYIPEAQTDFIFAIIGESFGYVGCTIVILLYFILIYSLIVRGLKMYKIEPFASYFCFGFSTLLAVHAFQNIGMTIGVMPITGIPLLLVSYGGSSVLSTMIGTGIAFRIAEEKLRNEEYIF